MSFSQIKVDLESKFFELAKANLIPICVSGTGDLVQEVPDYKVLVPAFSTTNAWMMIKVVQERRNVITVGNTSQRIFGSVEISVYSPEGSGGTGAAKIVDFLNENFIGATIGTTILRNLRQLREFDVPGWGVVVHQLSFQNTVKP